MRKSTDNIINFILIILSIIIITGTTYFCLDVFGIVNVPEKYSLANILYSKIEEFAESEKARTIENIIENSELAGPIKKIIKKDDNTEVIGGESEENRGSLLERLKEIEENKQLDEQSDPSIINLQDSKKLYYSQLDVYGKRIYDELYVNKDKLKTGTYTADFNTQFNDLLHEESGMDTLNNAFQLAINALTFDNPELFYIDVTNVYLLTETTTRAFSKTYRVSIGANGGNYLFSDFRSDSSVEKAIDDVENIKNNLVKECENKSTVEKLKIVHDYIIDNTKYDVNAGNNVYNAYGALINGACVCEGYARAYKYILDSLDIPCIIACGIGRNSVGTTESHAWNYVKINDSWYAVDTTWDDPILTNSSGQTFSGQRRDTYFLKGSNFFFNDHYEDGNIVGSFNFKYPKISETDF